MIHMDTESVVWVVTTSDRGEDRNFDISEKCVDSKPGTEVVLKYSRYGVCSFGDGVV